MRQDEFRQQLIDGTVQVIAREGLDKASAKQIELQTGINVVYIYRCFKDKEDMFSKVFDALDDEFLGNTIRNFEIMYISELPFVQRCRVYFTAVWEFLLSNRDKCLTYVRYFYSPYFTKYSAAGHKKRFDPLVEKFRNAFKDEADVWMILNHILNVILDFAVKVHNNQMQDSKDYVEHVFCVIYASIKQYFKGNEERDFLI